MQEIVQLVSLVMSGLTMLSLIGGGAAVFIKIGKREQQIDQLAISINAQAVSTQLLDQTLRRLESAMAGNEQHRREVERRLDTLERAKHE